MRVLHFCTTFSPLTETFIYDYVTELERQGIENYVATMIRQNENTRPFDRVEMVERSSKRNPLTMALRKLSSVGLVKAMESSWPVTRTRLKRVVKRVAPDVIHAHFGPAAVLASPVSQRLGVPLVATFYGYDISTLAGDVDWQRRYRRLWQHVSGVTVLSDDMRRRAMQLGCPETVIRIVHLSRDLNLLPAYRIPRRQVRRFISVGRFVEKKGHTDAVDAIMNVAASGTDVSLTIVGDGPLRPAVDQIIQDRGLHNRVFLRGALPNDETLCLMSEADALLVCSKTASNGDQEGTPTVLVEAQAMGLPCVATNHAGIPEMLPQEHHRFLANEGDVAALADRIQALCACPIDELQSIAARGRHMVEEQFNATKECSRLIELYEHVSPAKESKPDRECRHDKE